MTETAAIPTERQADLMFYMLDEGDGQPACLFFELDEEINIPAMRHAVAEASRRFPFFLSTLAAHDEWLWVKTGSEPLELTNETGEKALSLDPSVTGGHLLHFNAAGNRLSMTACHALTDGRGLNPLINTVFQLYYEALGLDINIPGARPAIVPLTAKDFIDPYDSMPDEACAPNTSHLKPLFALPEKEDAQGNVLHYVSADSAAFMNAARSLKASPNTLTASLLCRIVDELCDVPEGTEIDAGIAVDGRDTLGCPDSQRCLVNLLHLRYDDALRKSPLDVVNTEFRSRLAEQTEPQSLLNLFSKIRDGRRYLQMMPDLETRLDTFRRANKQEARTSTFSVSYGARLDLDAATEHVRSIHAVTAPYPLVIEVACIGSRFFFSFNQTFKSDRYARAFCNALSELGIPASYDGTEEIPPIPFTIPKQEA